MKLKFCILFAVFMVLGGVQHNLLAQTIQTDQSDYPPGSTATITGSGFAPNETVEVQVVNVTNPDDTGAEHLPWEVTTDANGNFTTTWFVTDDEANTTLQLTATGESSHLVAQVTFTDAGGPVNLSVAMGGTSISADTAGGSYTPLSGPSITEVNKGNIQQGTIILNAPSGFVFDTTANSVTATVTGDLKISTNSSGNGSSLAYAILTTNTITIWVNGKSTATACTIAWAGIKVRPTSATPLTNGFITETGTATFTYNTGSATNYGPLTEISGTATRLAFGVQPSVTTAGNAISPSVTVMVEDQFGNTVTNDSRTVTISSGTTAFTGSALSVAAANGVATFSNVKPVTAGTGNTLTASDGAITGATSSAFTVNAATATKLVFAIQPAGAIYKTAFTTQPVVKTQDAYGNNSTVGLGASVTASLTLTTGTGPLVGTTSLNIGTSGGNGTATFSGLQINRAENGDALTASATGFTSTNCASFNVSKVALTVTAQANTKTYDGTSGSANNAVLTGGTVQAGDTAPTWAQTYDTKNTGAGKTLTPSSLLVSDGNGGNNYSYTYTPVTTGVVNKMALTVTAQANTRIYDGTTGSATNAVLTGGTVQTGDTAPTWAQTYDNKNAGTGKTLTPSSVVVSDGNGGNNYSYTYAPVASGVINGALLTITANNQSKTYGTTLALGSAAFSVGSGLISGESVTAVTLTATGGTNATDAAGTYTITPSAATGTGGFLAANYSITYSTGTLTVNQATTAVSLLSSLNPSGFKDIVYFTATNLPSDATAGVVFLANGVPFSTNGLSSGGAASLAITNLARGTNIITAEYFGDANYTGSTNNLAGGQIVTNHPPVAVSFSYTNSSYSFKMPIATLLTHVSDPDGDAVTSTGFGISTNGVTIVTNATLFLYRDTNGVNDQFTYTVTDGYGGSATGTVSVVFYPFVPGQSGTVSPVVGGNVNLTYYGVPNNRYSVQRSINMVDWTLIWTTNAPANGVFQFQDNFSDLGAPPSSAFYRLIWNP
jgi:hypothetical protein